MTPPKATPASNYAQILKSSSVMGGAQILGYLISAVRTKVVAVLIGPAGVGLLGLYVSATELIGNLARLGINDSGVREVAEAQGSGDTRRIGHTVKTLRRICWLTGIAGWVLTAALADPLSRWAFGSVDHTWSIAILGSTLLLGAISGGQTALLQGTRRIGDVARLNLLSGATATVVGAIIYAVLREDGIVPVLICTALINLGFSWLLSRSIQTAPVSQPWSQTLRQSKRLIALGLAFMWSALLGSIVALGIRSLVVRHLGLDANGIYQAVIGISTVFGGLVLGAMSTDFYPHLTATVRDHAAATRLVNDQTEIGLLLALPGLQATLAFAPWLMRAFYSGEFVSGASLLPWYVMSVLCRMVTFPLGYVLVAKGASARYALITSGFHFLNLAGCALLIPSHGLLGVATLNTGVSIIYLAGMRFTAGPLIDFRWADGTRRLMIVVFLLAAAGFLCAAQLPPVAAIIAGTGLTLASCVVCARSAARRLGPHHRLARILRRIPLLNWACGLRR